MNGKGVGAHKTSFTIPILDQKDGEWKNVVLEHINFAQSKVK